MRKSLFIGLVAILGLIGCSRNQEIDVPDANLSIFARTESPAESRTVVESGTHVYWEPGDEIAVFMGEKAAKFTTDITAASGTATFKGTFGDQGWPEELDLWAVYPFSEDAVFDGETITTTLPSEQVAREGSFGKDMNLAIAHSSGTTLQFYNVGGGVRFSLAEEGIQEVVLEGLDGEVLSGKVKVGFQNGAPIIEEVTEGKTSITLTPSEGETFEKDTWYYIVAVPGSLEKGFKFSFHKTDALSSHEFNKAVTIKRNIYGTLIHADKEFSSSVPEAIDLGLSVKWASFNLGASKPEEYGDYYAWGEVETYYEIGYAQSTTPKWKPGKDTGYNWSTYKWCLGSEKSITRYCTNSEFGFNGFSDGKTVLELKDDVANVVLCGKWRIPTDEEWTELLSNCTSNWTIVNDVPGYRLTSRLTGNSIFLPAAGLRYETVFFLPIDDPSGHYWSSTLVDDEPQGAWSRYFSSGYEPRSSGDSRYAAQSIRPVYDDR